MTIPTYEISAELRSELRAAVTWWRDHGRPDLTEALALREALEDWLAALRAEHFGDTDIPPPASSLRVLVSPPADRDPNDTIANGADRRPSVG